MILTTGWRKFNFEFDFDSRFIPFDWFDFERFIVILKYATLNILKFKVEFEIHTLSYRAGASAHSWSGNVHIEFTKNVFRKP